MLIEMMEEWKENLENNFIIGAVLTDLSKAFDCIPHDLLIAKLSAYSLNDDLLCHIYSYFKDCKDFWNQNVKQQLIGFNIHNDKMIVNPEKFQLTKVALITLRLKLK